VKIVLMPRIRGWGIYLWALPASACGLILVLPLLLLGGKGNWVTGVLEVCAPRYCAQWVRHFGAITFGHVVIARDAEQMAVLREHERVHVRQYARCGVLFFRCISGLAVGNCCVGDGFIATIILSVRRMGMLNLKVKNGDHERYDSRAKNTKKIKAKDEPLLIFCLFCLFCLFSCLS